MEPMYWLILKIDGYNEMSVGILVKGASKTFLSHSI